MLIMLVFLSVLATGSYTLSKLISGALGMFVFSVTACAFFSWRYFTTDVYTNATNIFETTSNSLSEFNLPVAILTFVVSIFSGLYLFAVKATS